MRYDLDDLSPVSLDGHEGRAYQADVLNDIIDVESKTNWVTFRSACSKPFVAYMESLGNSPERKFFIWELLNEFACVLDAEGVRSGTDRREKYLNEKRKSWMMPLQSREEREVVLRLYDGFRKSLRDDKAIGTDQMIADFLNYLDSYRWEATRKKEGFDAVFVDELHLFNRQERMLFRHLLRDPEKPPQYSWHTMPSSRLAIRFLGCQARIRKSTICGRTLDSEKPRRSSWSMCFGIRRKLRSVIVN